VGAIAREVGLAGSGEVVDARNLPKEADALGEAVERGAVFGRVSPHQKRAMVQALQERGHVVAMTGDGVNDVLALKDADIGIAMGSGSSASRSVAQLVLIDGGFDTLPDVVGEGRRVIANIERVANLFVTKTIYAIFIAVAVGLAARRFPFLPRHLTLVGSVTIGIPAFFLALAPNARRARPGFIRRVLSFSVPTGLAAGIATFGAYELAIAEDVSLREARTTATLVLAAIGLFAIGMVARPVVSWKKALIGTMAGFLLLLLVAGWSQDFFELTIPRPAVLLAAVGIVAITGGVMIGTLRGVGWIRNVPEMLREGPPPEASRFFEQLRDRTRNLLQRDAPPIDEEAFVTPEDEQDSEPATVPLRRAKAIDWFDPEVDPVEVLNEPDTEPPMSAH
jgi:cation-transporting ATPase E